MSERPIKHVFIPQPPSDEERMAWSVADSIAVTVQHQAARIANLQSILHDAAIVLEHGEMVPGHREQVLGRIKEALKQ